MKELIRIDTPPFMERAACVTEDTETFYPDKSESSREAKAVCSGCPVRTECLTWALENDERFGVWGGLTEMERYRVRKGDTARKCDLHDCDESLPPGSASTRKFCSREHASLQTSRRAYAKKRMTCGAPDCNEPMPAGASPLRRYCSEECAALARKRRKEERGAAA